MSEPRPNMGSNRGAGVSAGTANAPKKLEMKTESVQRSVLLQCLPDLLKLLHNDEFRSRLQDAGFKVDYVTLAKLLGLPLEAIN